VIVLDTSSSLKHIKRRNALNTSSFEQIVVIGIGGSSEEFTIPENMGGRFSVLSAVGVVPLTFAGYDVKTLLCGAEDFIENFLKVKRNTFYKMVCATLG